MAAASRAFSSARNSPFSGSPVWRAGNDTGAVEAFAGAARNVAREATREEPRTALPA
ncbi:hypothetical protein ACIQ1J_03785 [Streptomyces sp. NPDC097107]|uniref:hypothetical protein n=1 Tax=Streptomyces sp. NPDC097107 TaxID=3366089 RepID=UPI0037F79D40